MYYHKKTLLCMGNCLFIYYIPYIILCNKLMVFDYINNIYDYVYCNQF